MRAEDQPFERGVAEAREASEVGLEDREERDAEGAEERKEQPARELDLAHRARGGSGPADRAEGHQHDEEHACRAHRAAHRHAVGAIGGDGTVVDRRVIGGGAGVDGAGALGGPADFVVGGRLLPRVLVQCRVRHRFQCLHVRRGAATPHDGTAPESGTERRSVVVAVRFASVGAGRFAPQSVLGAPGRRTAPPRYGCPVDFDLPADDAPERLEVREWFTANPQPTGRQLAEAGYVVPHWPRPWGLDAEPDPPARDRRRDAAREGVAARRTRSGSDWAGPTILVRGQRRAEGALPLPAARGRGALVPAVQRARSGQRPRVAHDPGGARRRRVSSSTARRSGRRWRPGRRSSASSSRAPTPTSRSTAASRTSSVRWTRPASRSGRSRR